MTIILAVLVLISSCAETQLTEWDYDQFIQAVEKNKINLVRVSGDQSQILFTTRDGEDVLVNLPPNNPNLISMLDQNGVDIVLVHSQSRFDQQSLWVGLALRWSIPILIGLVPTAIWVWALLDCAIYEEGGSNIKLLWLLIIFFTSVIGAMAYLIVRRPRRRRALGR